MVNHKRKQAHREQPQPALGTAIRELRRKQGETLKTFAPKAGVTWGTLGVIERGEANPTWGTVKGIAAALDISVSDLAKLAERFEASAPTSRKDGDSGR